jgi:hypothetical protein
MDAGGQDREALVTRRKPLSVNDLAREADGVHSRIAEIGAPR